MRVFTVIRRTPDDHDVRVFEYVPQTQPYVTSIIEAIKEEGLDDLTLAMMSEHGSMDEEPFDGTKMALRLMKGDRMDVNLPEEVWLTFAIQEVE